jgi:hypothetical protein
MRSIRESKKVSAVSAQQMRRQHKPQRIPLIPDIRWYSPSNVKALAQSAISFSLTRRSNDAESTRVGQDWEEWGEKMDHRCRRPWLWSPLWPL